MVSFASAKSGEIPSILVTASMQLQQGVTFQENSGNKTFGQLFDSNIVTNISPTSTRPPLARNSYKKTSKLHQSRNSTFIWPTYI